MTPETDSPLHRAELLLRSSRRALFLVLAMVLLTAATLLAHALRPGTLLADWPSKAPWMIPVIIVFFVASNAFGRRRPDKEQIRVLLEDEFRRANMARAQRLSLIVVLLLQAPLAIVLSGLTPIVAVTAMAEATITLGMVTLIVSFLVFDRG
jgi:hypothetical protein